jgi:hypothetical protein
VTSTVDPASGTAINAALTLSSFDSKRENDAFGEALAPPGEIRDAVTAF